MMIGFMAWRRDVTCILVFLKCIVPLRKVESPGDTHALFAGEKYSLRQNRAYLSVKPPRHWKWSRCLSKCSNHSRTRCYLIPIREAPRTAPVELNKNTITISTKLGFGIWRDCDDDGDRCINHSHG